MSTNDQNVKPEQRRPAMSVPFLKSRSLRTGNPWRRQRFSRAE